MVDGAPGRSFFVVDHQTAGRGRQGRQWLSPPGSALTVSLAFREVQALAPTPQRYTLLVSTALAEAIEAVAPQLQPSIKWPNDLLLGGRKVAGVLAESTWDGRDLLVIVGTGVNVNLQAADLAPIGGTATSLAIETGGSIDRGALLLALVEHLDAWLMRPSAQLFQAWSQRLWGRGQRLRLRGLESGLPDEEQLVTVLGVDADGALRVRLENGQERRTASAELIL
jgi:BirA family biotin operon repressor/biotin-[acetyl-CoA-carboxylase] ligase